LGIALKRFLGIGVLFAAISVNAAESTVPSEFLGDWVPSKASCKSKMRLHVASTTITLINGADSQQFGNIDVCHTCEGGAQYSGNVIWLSPEFNSGDAPFMVRFNADEAMGVAVVDMESSSIGNRFPIYDMKLRKCQTK
jgi:hypothetical protein